MEGQFGSIGLAVVVTCSAKTIIKDNELSFLSQMYHNNVLEFYIVTADENECNWMMFVRKARYDTQP